MKLPIAAMLALGACVSAAADPSRPAVASQPDPMAWAYGNTLETAVLSVGYFAERWIDPDHTWRDRTSSRINTGTWAIEDGQTCFTQTDPVPEEGYRRMCYAPTPHKVGDMWTSTDPVTGNTVTSRVVAGRRP